jgi:hypothetical protein
VNIVLDFRAGAMAAAVTEGAVMAAVTIREWVHRSLYRCPGSRHPLDVAADGGVRY